MGPPLLSTAQSSPPGLQLPLYLLGRDVVSCVDAAAEKKIPLANELKTLILTTSLGTYALHLRGDRHASMRKVKRFLSSAEAHLMAPEPLLKIGLTPGTVSAVLDPVWELPHLVDESVLALQFVSTNNRTRRAYFVFDPHLLLNAVRVSVGAFEA